MIALEEEIGRKTTLKVTRILIDLEDKLLQDVLLYSCMTDTVYSSGYEDWVAYSDPIPAEPVTVESTPAPTPLTESFSPLWNRRQPYSLRQLLRQLLANSYNYSPSIECMIIGYWYASDVDTTVSVHFDFEGVTTS
jgi:hypothetical protein